MKKGLLLSILLIVFFCLRIPAQDKEKMDMKGMDMSSHKQHTTKVKKPVKVVKTSAKKHSHSKHCQECAEACKQCAEEYGKMAA